MISYLIYSTICLGLILLFYHVVLVKEKIYQINRFYLLTGLLFALTIPFMPVGVVDSWLKFGNNPELQIQQLISSVFEYENSKSALEVSANSSNESSDRLISNLERFYPLLLFLYSIVTLFVFIRMFRQLDRMHLRSARYPSTYISGYKVVLLNDDTVPHTFWKTIFVNREQYENGEICEEILIHELTHARQNHSLDIFIIELLKSIFWFNPVIYFYKTAIQLNHEFIADEKVLSEKADIADYQALLLRTRTAKTNRYLGNSLNFNITKKRFTMMTKTQSTYSSLLKTAAIIPFFLMLGLTFGCEPASVEEDIQTNNITLELSDSETIQLNGESLSISEFRSKFFDLPINPEKTTIHFKVHPSTPYTSFGIVTDVQEILRERGTLRVNYSTSPIE